MKQYKKEEIAALLEKAASEIEIRDAKIKELEEQIEAGVSTITKTASFNSIDEEFGQEKNWNSLGEPSAAHAPSVDAETKLVEFLNNLS